MDLFKILYITLVYILFTVLSPVNSLDWLSWLFGSIETTQSQFHTNKGDENNGAQNKTEKRFLTADAEASWSEWSDVVSECSVTCGRGIGERTRTCSSGIRSDCYGIYYKLDVCELLECHTATWTPWTEWSICSSTCDEGFQGRSRTCDTGTNEDCGDMSAHQVQRCNLGVCQAPTTSPRPTITGTRVPAVWSAWSTEVLQCSVTCDAGVGEMTRQCSTGVDSDCGGFNYKLVPCNPRPCAKDGFWSYWSKWTSCSHTCGHGSEMRYRTCQFDPSFDNGNDCTGSANETRHCFFGECPVDGSWGDWTTWTTCSKTCNGGIQSRNRDCDFPDGSIRGSDCIGDGEVARICNTHLCSVDGRWSAWSGWSQCTQSCDGGITFRARACEFLPGHPHGAKCTGPETDSMLCNTDLCTADGSWTVWSAWTPCTVTCGGGVKYKGRSCLFLSGHPHGKDCVGNSTEKAVCNRDLCPVDGHWGSWSSWTICTTSCGNGTKERTRTCTYTDGVPHGDPCDGAHSETTSCNPTPCPVDGGWSLWGMMSPCSVTCGDGERTKTRTCIFPAGVPHGKTCIGQSITHRPCTKAACAVDGVWEVWSSWNDCSKTCDTGYQLRTRNCHFQPGVPHGADCHGLNKDTRKCNTDLCPTTTTSTTTPEPTGDGSWSAWSEWTSCTATCDNGTHSRNRTCLYPPHLVHGHVCSGLSSQTDRCNINLCPLDGHLGAWYGWSRCSHSCGNGTHIRNRDCQFNPHYPRGNNCTAPLHETGTCNSGLCPVDGTWSFWTTWDSCSKSCGNGIQSRSRTCEFPDGVSHGEDCHGNNHENRTCNSSPCPVDGKWTDWAGWSPCTVSCGNGTKTRSRTCSFIHGAPHGANCTGELKDTIRCNTSACPVDGVWRSWSQWSACTKTCDTGEHSRTRECFYPDGVPRGTHCNGSTSETAKCNRDLCPVDGSWTTWSDWSKCSLTCSNGTSTRNRQCIFLSGRPHGHNCTGMNQEIKTCSEGLCPVDGVWSNWGAWKSCSLTCGNGTQSRTRICEFTPGQPHGHNCTGEVTQHQSCSTNLCPVNGLWHDWSNWTTCSHTCGNGTQSRDRICYFPSGVPHGNNCSGSARQVQTCNPNQCPVDGVWDPWSEWSPCTKSCGTGIQFQRRKCQFPLGVPHGTNCTGLDTIQQNCRTNLCPKDGIWKEWVAWSSCSKSCENGTQSRTRVCYYDPTAPVGKPCPGDAKESISCNTERCPIDGKWSDWSSYSTCSETCGNGTHTRNRSCIFNDPAAPHGAACFGVNSTSEPCNAGPCPVDGTWSAWTNYTACSKTCGGGIQFRSRQCLFQMGHPHGRDCIGNKSSSQECQTNLCPVNGFWDEWSPWSSCIVSCGNGTEQRARKCQFDPKAPKGDPCHGYDKESKECFQGFCPKDGKLSSWSSWTGCSLTCGNGTRSRSRSCVFEDGYPHGANCAEHLNSTEPCSTNPCPVDGAWKEWSSWSLCTATCHGGVRTRNRTCVYTANVPRGLSCLGNASETQSCADKLCPVDGVWSSWSNLTDCTQTCGNGTQHRQRTCIFPNTGADHGKNCSGSSTETLTCNPSICPVDGHWDTWSSWSTCSHTCGFAVQNRQRTCIFKEPTAKGNDCVGNVQETQDCAMKPCPVNGTWTDWNAWSSCSQSCDNGTMTRKRTCHFLPEGAPHDHNCTGDSQENKTCMILSCPAPTTPTTIESTETTLLIEPTTTFSSTLPAVGTTNSFTKPAFTCTTCGDNNEDMCEFSYDSNTVCPEPYCVNILRNPDTGQRLLMRKCGTLQECKTDWWQQSSQIEQCNLFNGNFIYTEAFECTYCCTTPNCNDEIHPADTTLYKEN